MMAAACCSPPVAVAICYEIIFPGHVVDDLFRPDWIFNATNDAWFGTTLLQISVRGIH